MDQYSEGHPQELSHPVATAPGSDMRYSIDEHGRYHSRF